MNDLISKLSPQPLWQHFYQLTQIPRPSHFEAAVQAHVIRLGERLGLETIRDQNDNILIRKPATPGMEQAPGVILQGHLDMVPQANADTQHDFTQDPITVVIEKDWVKAKGTTLGADNGIGVAAALAVLESRSIKHGPIEALFTSNEEDGMTGAFGVQPDLLKGTVLLNMDSEDEGVLCIGCAGGANATTTLRYIPEPLEPGKMGYLIAIRGLKGGHSGVDIHRGRANANKLLFRLIAGAANLFKLQLCCASGGNMRNAIPREGTAAVAVSASDANAFRRYVSEQSSLITAEYAVSEPDLVVEFSPDDSVTDALPEKLQRDLLDCLSVVPNGVMRMSDAMPGLVETSTNLAIVRVEQGAIEIKSLLRSSVDSARDDLAAVHQSLYRLLGADTLIDGVYPGWKPNTESPLLKTMRQVYQEIFDATAEIGAIHAGLECGIIGGRYENLDMISFGPTIRYPHSPDECMHIPSVQRFWDLLVATLSRLV
ncbi:aminoacyl-histidine dipeptidase [Sedimenticola selenatireducens]|uniref:Cytosol non-specific dipeptidase n=1 Tax=Sedimenticola selenatireducens TaxID=191960 RepID=A0A557RUM4_9GAMM|nr:aminoacyl-histidine dipeptidase [Sedimenticola selenatireducens]TVO68865.1 aminoacyl-histidine dipeptidase [Sedimenticola selenatireducens]TVT61237.1 MAG: aminoacyl-histidine dipeptidase [Sedimenticola selenatireducens]